LDCGLGATSTLSGNNITLNANNNINAAGVNIQADNSISGTAKDINIQNVNNTDTHYSKHKKVKVSLADVLGCWWFQGLL
jgi:hypothetical protein